MKRFVTLAALALLLLAPGAAAQALGEFSVDVADATAKEFPPGTATAIPVDVTVGCDIILQGAPEDLVVVLTTDLPASWGATGSSVTFGLDPACLTGEGAITESGTITVNPTADAIALTSTEFTITATGGGETGTFPHPASWVIYTPGHTLTPNIQFPYQYTDADEGSVDFVLDLQISANADTMVMFENVDADGTVNGLAYQYFYPSQGDFVRNKTMQISWTPPAGAWESDNITFLSYSHCLADPPCDANVHKTSNVTYAWRIDNGASASGGGGGGGGGKDSPGLGGLMLVGLVAAALVARRR